MHTIIVVPPHARGTEDHSRLASGEKLAFGRSAAGGGLTIAHEGVSRAAGVITAHGAFWTLSNLSARQTYVVENPEGAGEHIKVVPGRVDAPVPFEFSRVVLPAAGDLLGFDVWAPHQEILDTSGWSGDGALTGTTTAPAFSLDHTKRYFAVLVALCEPRLRGAQHAPPPTAEALVERLRATWPTATRATVQWNINYLRGQAAAEAGPGHHRRPGATPQRQEGVAGLARAPVRPRTGGRPGRAHRRSQPGDVMTGRPHAVQVPAGYRVGRWEVREPIASGGFGTVYAARATSGNAAQPQSVAVNYSAPNGTELGS